MLSMLVALALSQNTATMSGIPPRQLALDFTQTILMTIPGTLCAGTDLTTDQAGAVTVSRNNTAYCQTATTITTVSANKPRIEATGILVEPGSSNRVTQSEDLSSFWSSSGATEDETFTAPDGTSTALAISTASAGDYYESPSFTISSTSAVASVFAMHAVAGAQAYAFRLRDTTAGADRCTGTGTTSATAFVWPVMNLRASCSSTGIVSGNTHVLRVYPGGVAGSGTAVAFWGAQVEPGRTVMTSYIKTAGAAASRAADNVTFTTTSNVAAGCASAYATGTTEASGRVLTTGNGDVIGIASTTQFFANDGTTTITAPATTSYVNNPTWMKTSWSGSTFRIYSGNTGNSTSGSFDGSMGQTTYYIGSNQSVLQYLNGNIQKIKVSTDPAGCSP